MPSTTAYNQKRNAKLKARGLCINCAKRPAKINAQGKVLNHCAECNGKYNKTKRERERELAKEREYVIEPIVEQPKLRVKVTRKNFQKLVANLAKDELTALSRFVTRRISDIKKVERSFDRDRIVIEALELMFMAGGADNWVAERREEEARRASREFKRHYDQYFSTEAF